MLDLHSNQEKFGSFLRAALDVLSQLLELATLNDINKVIGWLNDCWLHCVINYISINITWHLFWQCVEEILGYLKSCFSREPTMATVCVQQVSDVRGYCCRCCVAVFSSSTEQCAASGTPHRARLVPADRACKVFGLPVRWFHTSYLHILNSKQVSQGDFHTLYIYPKSWTGLIMW